MARSNGGHSPHVDARRVVVPLWGAAVISLSVVGIAFGTGAFYWNVSSKIDSLVTSVNALSSSALTARDLENFCLRAEVQNKGKWSCPFIEAEASNGNKLAGRSSQEAN